MASTKLLGFFLLPVYSCDFDPDLTLTLLSFIPSVPRDPVEGVHLMRGLRARTRGSRQVTRNPESRLPRAAEEELARLLRRDLGGPSCMWEGVETQSWALPTFNLHSFTYAG